jgi:hypothetical protein
LCIEDSSPPVYPYLESNVRVASRIGCEREFNKRSIGDWIWCMSAYHGIHMGLTADVNFRPGSLVVLGSLRELSEGRQRTGRDCEVGKLTVVGCLVPDRSSYAFPPVVDAPVVPRETDARELRVKIMEDTYRKGICSGRISVCAEIRLRCVSDSPAS